MPDRDYRRILASRWSRRDRLGSLVIAGATAFFVACVLLAVAASAGGIALTSDLGSPGTVTADGPADAGVTLPIAEATIDGEAVTVVGLPAAGHDAFALPSAPTDGIAGPDATEQVTIVGSAASVDRSVTPRTDEETAIPSWWYLAEVETVEQLGVTDRLAIEAAEPTAAPHAGSPLRTALPFFLVGQAELVGILLLVALASGVLVAVTTYGVVGMAVTDRRRTIHIARATGARPRDVLLPFVLRGTGIAALGVLLGGALGIVAPNVAVNAAIYRGVETTLHLRVDETALRLLAPATMGLVALGGVAGAVAAWPAATNRTLPGRTRPRAGRGLDVLGWSVVVPTAASLAVLLATILVLAAVVATTAPIATPAGMTMVEPGASHPFASQVPADRADALEATGVNASPEILGFGLTDGQAYLVRGVEFDRYATITDVRLTTGERPTTADEFLVGDALADRLGVSVGDTLLVGGSTDTRLHRGTVVGRFTAPGAHADQVLVPLPAARHLVGTNDDMVAFVRTELADDAVSTPEGARILAIDLPDRAPANATAQATVTVWNGASTERTETIRIDVGDRSVTEPVTLAPGQQHEVTITIETSKPDTYPVRVGTLEETLTVVDPDEIEMRGLPASMPPGAEPLVQLRDATGEPVADATVTVGEESVATDEDGWARLPAVPANATAVTIATAERTRNVPIDVDPAADRTADVELRVIPRSPSLATVPEVAITLLNPWNRTLSSEIGLVEPSSEAAETVTVAPGEETTVRLSLARQPPGEYPVRVSVDDDEFETTYRVGGDERLGAALAAGGHYTTDSPLGQAVEAVIGNVIVVFGTLLAVAAAMTAGGLAAALSRSALTRRHTIGIYRATGAGPRRLYRLLVRDALVVGGVATIVGLLLAGAAVWLAASMGLLSLFGMSVQPTLAPPWLATGIAASLALVLVTAVGLTAHLLRTRPRVLLWRW